MVSNKLAPKAPEGTEQMTFSTFVSKEANLRKINEMVGTSSAQRFITSIISAVSVNPALAVCEPASILSAAMLGEALKLSPSPQLGQYYMIPFKKTGKTDDDGNVIIPDRMLAQFQLGYKGYIQLAIRSGAYKKINVLAIKEGELVRFDPLNEEIKVNLIDDDIKREETPTIGYYAMFEYTNGFRKAMYWSKQKMIAHADKYSQAFSKEARYGKVSFADYEAGKYNPKDARKYSSFWYKDFDGMAYKTMLRQLISKWGIMSIELQNAINSDMAAINEDGTPDYIENQPEPEVPQQEAQSEKVESIQAEFFEVDPETGETIQDSFFN